MDASKMTVTVALSVFAALFAGTLYRLLRLRAKTNEVTHKRLGSLLSWWLVAIAVVGCAMAGRAAATALLACVSCLGFHEFVGLNGPNERERVNGREREARLPKTARGLSPTSTRPIAAGPIAAGQGVLRSLGWVVIGALYAGLASGFGLAWLTMMPLATVVVGGPWLLKLTPLKNFSQSIAVSLHGVVLTGCLPATTVLLFDIDDTFAWPAGMFLLVVGLTQCNDILSAWVGRALGRRRLAPAISPNKTIAGCAGGMIGTVALACLVGPPLASLTNFEAGLLGIGIAISGTLGDLNMSAIKRAAGVKDSGTLLPGQGGILDRIDSLTFAAPVALLMVEWMR